jgi:DNA-binding NarL/FixJ family response regulator
LLLWITIIIKEKYPGIKFVILTTFNEDEFIFEALKNGATSYLLKDIASEEIINTIKIINAGGTVLHNNIASRLLNRAVSGQPNEPNLTQREEEAARLVAEGILNRDIAQRLFIRETFWNLNRKVNVNIPEIKKEDIGDWNELSQEDSDLVKKFMESNNIK